jgi:hypothetical protein
MDSFDRTLGPGRGLDSTQAAHRERDELGPRTTWADSVAVRVRPRVHAFVTQMETWRAELTNMARRAVEDPAASANPLTAFAGEFQTLAAR